MKVIRIATEFSKYPGLRFEKLGKHSGEKFRKDVLLPALQGNEKVVVHLDGTKGYGSSFLDEAFGGVVRQKVHIGEDNLSLVSDDDLLIQEIWGYIAGEKKRLGI